MTDIHIIGVGLVSCLGGDVQSTWQGVLGGHSGIRPLDRFPVDEFAQTHGGQLDAALEEQLRCNRPDDDLAFAMILQAAGEALRPNSGSTDTGLVLATNFGLMETREWCWRERLDVGEMDETTFCLQQDVCARVAGALGLAGPRGQLSLSCASGGAAVALARQWLLGGRCRRVLCVCYDALTEFCWCGLANLHTITDEKLRPFDVTRHGTIFSEGAAAILLSVDPADAGGSQGRVLGAATNNNAFHLTAPAKNAAGSRRAMAAALAHARVSPEQVDLVAAHATGTTANDVTEAAAINALLGKRRVPVIALKSAIGHMLGAAGLAEILLTLRALNEGIAPAVQNLEQQDPDCNLDVVCGVPRRGDYAVALTNSAGIGGNNAATVIGRSSFPPAPAPAAASTVKLLGAGWVLPGNCGSGRVLPNLDPENLLGRNGELEGFSVKPYIHSVKGYLDPAGAFALAATALCLRDKPPAEPESTAVITATQYGATLSAFRFFEQMITKGHRFASPMIFPHSYSNTAGNLVAIEFGLAGPHFVFDTAPDLAEAVWLGVQLLRTGSAREAIVIGYEATCPQAIPDHWQVLNGAIAVRLGIDRETPHPFESRLPCRPQNRQGTVFSALLPSVLHDDDSTPGIS